MTYTNDKNKWWELEHEFASTMTTRNRNPEWVNDPAEDAYSEAYYEWFLGYCRGLNQDDFVALVQRYAPELQQMVEV